MKILTLLILLTSLSLFADDSIDEPKKPNEPQTCYCEVDVLDDDGFTNTIEGKVHCPSYEESKHLVCTGNFWGPLMDVECKNTKTKEYYVDSEDFEGVPQGDPSCSAY